MRTEAECVESLLKRSENPDYSNGDFIVLNITNNFDIWYNYTHMSPEWRIGNLKIDGIEEIMRRINEEDTFAQREARKITFAELAERYGDAASERAFSIGDYESYLFNKHLDRNIRIKSKYSARNRRIFDFISREIEPIGLKEAIISREIDSVYGGL